MFKLFALSAAVLGFLGVALGAFGAHGLKSRLGEDMLAVWQTAVQYQFWHVLALLVVAILLKFGSSSLLNAAGWAFLAGILLFSGSLYLLAFTGVKILGAITPIGGLAFLVGWGCLVAFVIRS
ncbi:MAG: DUF423 domain-containing protein [Cellvibrionaceae bacterium]